MYFLEKRLSTSKINLMTVYDVLAVHQKRKTILVLIKNANLIMLRTLEHLKYWKTKRRYIQKDNIGENNKKKQLKRVQPGTYLRSEYTKTNNRKQVLKEKAKTEDTNKEKQTKKKKIYILGDSLIKYLKGLDISAKLKSVIAFMCDLLQVQGSQAWRLCKAMHSRR